MSKENSSSSGGIGFCGLLTIVFIVLKLTKFINWSWGWVLSPMWIPLAVWVLVTGGLFIYIKIVEASSTEWEKEQMKRIMDEQKANTGKSKWQQRLDDIQKAKNKA
jgi:hypothetical protein